MSPVRLWKHEKWSALQRIKQGNLFSGFESIHIGGNGPKGECIAAPSPFGGAAGIPHRRMGILRPSAGGHKRCADPAGGYRASGRSRHFPGAEAGENARVLDLCAGSGCVGLAVAQNAVNCRVVLADVSETILALCKRNARRNNLLSRVTVFQTDALEPPRPFYGTLTLSCAIRPISQQPRLRRWSPR